MNQAEIDLKSKLQDVINKIGTKDIADVQDRLFKIATAQLNSDISLVHIAEAFEENLLRIKGRMDGTIPPALKSSWRNFNSILGGGLHEATTYIIGARPSVGKTALVDILLDDIEDLEVNSGIEKAIISWNFELTNAQRAARLTSKKTGLTVNELMSADRVLTQQEFEYILSKKDDFVKKKRFLVDVPRKVTDMTKTVIAFAKKYPNHQIINDIDHTLLAQKLPKQSNMELVQELSKSCLMLKKTVHCTNIILSQLSRDVEGIERRANMYDPMTSDLVWSSELEHDANVIILLNNPGRLGLKEYEAGNHKLPTDDLLVGIVVKNRDGGLGHLFFRSELAVNNLLEYDFADVMNNQ